MSHPVISGHTGACVGKQKRLAKRTRRRRAQRQTQFGRNSRQGRRLLFNLLQKQNQYRRRPPGNL